MKDKYYWPIIGHSNIKKYLQKQISNKQIPHALLFSGPEHLGKFTLSKIFAKSIHCSSSDKVPCNTCNDCQNIDKEISSDFIIIKKLDDKQNIGIKQIRELQQKLSLKSFDTKYRIIIIYNAEELSEEASNALLKTLEEPYPNVLFIIVTGQIEKIPLTIKSRCQILNFSILPNYQILNWLITKEIDKKSARIISEMSLGKPGVALNYLEDEKLIDLHKEKTKLLIDLLKTQSIGEKFSLVSSYLGKDTDNDEIIHLLQIWEQLIRDFIIIKFNKNISNTVYLNTIIKISESLKLKKLFKFYKDIKDSNYLIQKSINPKLVMENLILKF